MGFYIHLYITSRVKKIFGINSITQNLKTMSKKKVIDYKMIEAYCADTLEERVNELVQGLNYTPLGSPVILRNPQYGNTNLVSEEKKEEKLVFFQALVMYED